MAAKPSNEVISLLSAFDWEDGINRLVLYAQYKAEKYKWRGIFGGVLPEGMNPNDIVSIAIEKVLTGERNWDPEKQPNLYLYLRSVVDSLLSSYSRGLENRSFVGNDEMLQYIKNDEDDLPPPVENLPSSCLTAEQELINLPEMNDAEECILTLYDFLQDKPFLQSMLECIEIGIEKPADMAEKLKVPVKEIYNANKQLNRKLIEFKSVWESRNIS